MEGELDRRELSQDSPLGQSFLHGIEQGAIEDRLVLAPMRFAAIDYLADVEAVLKHVGERSDHKALGGDGGPVGEQPGLWPDAFLVERGRQLADRAEPQIVLIDFADQRRLLSNNFELLADAAIAERDRPSDPDPLALGGGDLVAHPLADHLALELGEREQHIERQPPHARGGVEGLRHRDEGDGVFVEQFDELGEVGERSCQPVDFTWGCPSQGV